MEALEEINPLPDLMNSKQQKIKGFQVNNKPIDTNALPNCVTIHEDQQLDINTLPNCVTNNGKRNSAHPIGEKTPANGYALSHRVITSGRQSVALPRKTNNFVNNPDQQKTTNHNIPTDICRTPATDSNIYLVDQVKNHRHQNGKLEFLIKWLRYSNCVNTWEAENHFSPALVQEYFQQSEL